MKAIIFSTLFTASSLVNADIYFCVTEAYSEISSNGTTMANSANRQEWIIDPEKGFRMAVVSEYAGICSLQDGFINCDQNYYNNGAGARAFRLNLTTLNFATVQSHLGNSNRGASMWSYTGSCYKG